MAEMSVSTPLKLAEPSEGARLYSGHWDIARNTNKSLLVSSHSVSLLCK